MSILSRERNAESGVFGGCLSKESIPRALCGGGIFSYRYPKYAKKFLQEARAKLPGATAARRKIPEKRGQDVLNPAKPECFAITLQASILFPDCFITYGGTPGGRGDGFRNDSPHKRYAQPPDAVQLSGFRTKNRNFGSGYARKYRRNRPPGNAHKKDP